MDRRALAPVAQFAHVSRFSELLPHTAKHADDLCFVRSMFSESSNHAPATYLMNTGAILGGRPSFGSWVTYGNQMDTRAARECMAENTILRRIMPEALELNDDLSPESRYVTLAHELGHLYCGHLGTPNEKWWPDRRG